MKKIKPFLKWAGNKYNCLDKIIMEFPPGKRLIEPFTGSGAIFINSLYPSYLLAEDNKDLVSLFSILKKEGDPFIAYCAEFFSEQNNCESKYYEFRTEFNSCTDKRRKSALFLYLNRHGYNGLCRYNQSGIFNVPFGRYIKPYFPRKEMINFQQKSKNAKFIHKDFRQTFAKAIPGDVIYCDPPYAPLKQESNFSSYTQKKFGEEEQIILAELAMEAMNKNITVIISNHDTEFTRHHYRDAKIKSFLVRRNISCNSANRLPVQELLAIFSN